MPDVEVLGDTGHQHAAEEKIERVELQIGKGSSVSAPAQDIKIMKPINSGKNAINNKV